MTDYHSTSTHVFRDLLTSQQIGSNNPLGVQSFAGDLDDFVELFRSQTVSGAISMVESATKGTALIYHAVLVARRELLDLALQSIIKKDSAKGNTFGAQLMDWITKRMDTPIRNDLNVVLGALRSHMSSTLEMLTRNLTPIPGGPLPTTDSIEGWINKEGGIGALHMKFMAQRRKEAEDERLQLEKDARENRERRRLKQAQEAGFDTVEAYDIDRAQESERQRQAVLRAKFDVVKQELVAKGTLLEGDAPEGALLIASGGKLYVISDEDEFALLQCAATLV